MVVQRRRNLAPRLWQEVGGACHASMVGEWTYFSPYLLPPGEGRAITPTDAGGCHET
jgi:hypothetical protein